MDESALQQRAIQGDAPRLETFLAFETPAGSQRAASRAASRGPTTRDTSPAVSWSHDHAAAVQRAAGNGFLGCPEADDRALSTAAQRPSCTPNPASTVLSETPAQSAVDPPALATPVGRRLQRGVPTPLVMEVLVTGRRWTPCRVTLPHTDDATFTIAITATQHPPIDGATVDRLVVAVDAIAGTSLCNSVPRSMSLTVLFAAGRSPVAGVLSLRARTAADLEALSDGVFDAVHRSRRAAAFRAAVAEIDRQKAADFPWRERNATSA
jgi:hypothetical protein